MIVYPPDQLAAVTDPQSRHILAERGLPDRALPGFQAARALRRYGDTGYLELGTDSGGDAYLLLDPGTGGVLVASKWVDEIAPVNTSLAAFVACQDMLADAAPFYPADADLDELDEIAQRLRDRLEAIDPASVADPDGYWQSFIWDVAQGDYPEEVTG